MKITVVANVQSFLRMLPEARKTLGKLRISKKNGYNTDHSTVKIREYEEVQETREDFLSLQCENLVISHKQK